MSTADQTQAAAGAQTRRSSRLPGTGDRRHPSAKPDQGRQGPRLPRSVHRPGRQARPGRLQGRRGEHQVLDQRNRQEAVGAAQRDSPQSRSPEAGSDLARPALPGSSEPRPARRSRSACSTSRSRSCSRTSRRRSSSTRARLFKKIYEEEYGQLGGKPYGHAGGRLRVRPRRRRRQPAQDDIERGGGGPCAVRRHPSPKLFGFDRFTELSNPRDLAKIFDSVEYAAWKSFRESEDARYVALTMPRMLGRLPYGPEFKKVSEFNFVE